MCNQIDQKIFYLKRAIAAADFKLLFSNVLQFRDMALAKSKTKLETKAAVMFRQGTKNQHEI